MSAATLPARRAETNGNNQIAERGGGGAKNLQQLLESRREAMAMVLPKHLTPDRLIKIALVAISKTPKLQECTQTSVLQSIMTAAQLGLDVGGALGHAYMVPYGRECQLIIGYRGMIDLARRSGQIVSIEARIVWTNDEFEVDYAIDGVKLRHRPALDKEPGTLRLVYGIAVLRDGGTQFELMTRAQIDAIRKRSRSSNNGPWVTDYEEMARKTVVKRLFKYLPVSIELAQAVEEDTRGEFGDIDLTKIQPAPSASDLNKRLSHQPLPALPELIEPANESSDQPAPESSQANSLPPASEPVQPSGGEEGAGPSEDDLAIEAFADEGAQDWTTFTAAFGALNHDAEVVTAALKKLKVTGDYGAAKRSGIEARKKLLIAAKLGKFDFKTLTIQE